MSEGTTRRQRADRGYSDVDLWNLDAYLAQILAHACPRLREGDGDDWDRKMDRLAELCSRYEPTSFKSKEEQAEADELCALLAETFQRLWT